MIEKEAFIAALLPICDTVCEYDRTRGKLRVRKTDLASGLEDKWYTVEELRDIFRDNGGVSAEKSVWMRYLSSENLRSFFYEKERNESFRLRFRQGGVGCRQYDVRIDRISDYVLVISGRDTQEQEIDALTGALSRNHYQRDMSNEIYRGGVALIDMDDLKLYNDINGHQVGDNALRVLADTIYEVVGCSGSLVRYGGDEVFAAAAGRGAGGLCHRAGRHSAAAADSEHTGLRGLPAYHHQRGMRHGAAGDDRPGGTAGGPADVPGQAKKERRGHRGYPH